MASKKRSKFSLDEETLGYYKNVSAMFNDKSQEQSEKGMCPQNVYSSTVLVYTYFIATNYSNGVGSQVLATLVTTLPLHIQINQSM